MDDSIKFEISSCSSNEVPLYRSDSDSEDESAPKKKMRGENKNWLFVKKYDSIEEAEKAVRDENSWSISSTNMTEEGRKRFYRCNKVKRRGPQCAAQIYLLFEATSNSVLHFRTESEHDHDLVGVRSDYGISKEVKEQINKLIDLHMKPRGILKCLSQIKGIKLPTTRQINNYLADRRRVKYAPPTISLSELEQWILNHVAVPENDHKAFVISHSVVKGTSPTFRFVLSTKNLLKLACSAKILHADSTHKLLWQGFPVLIVGTTDKDTKFYPLCLGVANCEEKEDFEIIFQGLKEKVLSLYSHSLEPSVLVYDSECIRNAFVDTFGSEATVRVCWTFARKNMLSKLERTIDKNIKKNISEDIDDLHSAPSWEVFHAASDAFIKKWEGLSTFIKSFKEELTQNCYWYSGAAPGSPATNDSLGVFNKEMKDKNTLRERFPLSRFVVVASEMVTEWSQAHNVDSFSNAPTIKLSAWTEAYQWAKMDKKITSLPSNNEHNTYLVASDKSTEDIQTELHWKTFDEYKKVQFSYWKITMTKDKCDWMYGCCSCPQFLRKYICKHVLGLAIRLGYASPPLEAKVFAAEKKKRGRPSKSKPPSLIITE